MTEQESFLEGARELCTLFNNKVVETEREIAAGQTERRLLTDKMRLKKIDVPLQDGDWKSQEPAVSRAAIQATRGAKKGERPMLIPSAESAWQIMYVSA